MKKSIFGLILLLLPVVTMAKIKTIIDVSKNTVQQDKVYNSTISNSLVKLHMKLGYGINDVKVDTKTIMGYIEKMDQLLNIDILDMLKVTKDKETILLGYISDSQSVLDTVMLSVSLLQQDIHFLDANIIQCSKQKEVSDQRFFDALNNYDALGLQDALEDSKDLGVCITNNRVEYNAKVSILNKVIAYYDALDKKKSYLEQNLDIIVKNIDVLDTVLLKKLGEVDNMLNRY